jgi:glycerol-3-phosphate dehydrogenase (NAD(P)+)
MKLAVVGGGSWGTALAVHLARCGHEVGLWVRDPEVVRDISTGHENARYLPGVSLAVGIRATTDPKAAMASVEAAFMAVPSAAARDAYRMVRESAAPGMPLVSLAKGLEIESLKRLTEVAAEEAPGHPLAVLSGPSFAVEVARGQPTAVVVASSDEAVAERVQRAVAGRTFRAYSSDDVVGVELAGALKNVIAIAAGVVDGLGYGQNTVAALVTRGLAEITRLAVREGGRADTLAGLAGLGDLVLTCTGDLSRNRKVGRALGRGSSLAAALAETRTVAEGVRTSRAASLLAERAGVEMPIVQQMNDVLYGGKHPRAAVDELMLRSLKRE